MSTSGSRHVLSCRDLIQERLEKKPTTTTSFAFDDAFSDADDGNANYTLSSIVIRADLARAVSHSQEGKEQESTSESSATGADAMEDTTESLPRVSMFVFGLPVILRGPHHSAGIFRAPL